jgi:membrane fusion protein (multidrug efflux system)
MAANRSRLFKLFVSLFVVSAAGAVVFLIARMPAPPKDVPQEEFVVANVEVMEVRPVKTMSDLLVLPGVVEPWQIVDVPVEQRGQIEEVLVDEGQSVTEGDLLLKLDETLLRALFDQAKAQADFDERMAARSSELLERGVVRKSEVDELQARWIVSRANLRVAETNLDRTSVRAPMSGVVNELVKERGEFVSPGDTVAQIVAVDRVKVAIQIPEKDIRFIRPGMTIRVAVDSLEGRDFAGKVTYISEIADTVTRTTPIELTLDNAGGALHAGMIVRCRISRRTLSDVVMIPLASVIPLENGRVVYVVEEGKAQRREVTLGMIRGTEVQILQGLDANDLLIVTGQRLVGPGQQVNIQNAG